MPTLTKVNSSILLNKIASKLGSIGTTISAEFLKGVCTRFYIKKGNMDLDEEVKLTKKASKFPLARKIFQLQVFPIIPQDKRSIDIVSIQ